MALGLLIGTRLIFFTTISGSLMAPGIVVLALLGAYGVGGRFSDVVIAASFGLISVFMQRYGYSRVALIIALVLGGLVEASYHQSMTTFGVQGFVTRPIALTLLALTILVLVLPYVRKRKTAVAP